MNHKILNSISVKMDKPSDVIRTAVKFMCDIIINSKYVIFQSTFGFAESDSPFTLIAEKLEDEPFTQPNMYKITYGEHDYSKFLIDEDYDGTISEEWTVCADFKIHIPDYDKMSAKEIINFPNTKDEWLTQTEHISFSNLQPMIFAILYRSYVYREEDDYTYNDFANGGVAVIYRERNDG